MEDHEQGITEGIILLKYMLIFFVRHTLYLNPSSATGKLAGSPTLILLDQSTICLRGAQKQLSALDQTG
jgi:hypothetical protein